MNIKSGHLSASPYKYSVRGSEYADYTLQGFTSDNGKTYKWYVIANPNVPSERKIFPQEREFKSPEEALQALSDWENKNE